MPIQSSAAEGVAGTVELEPEFAAGLKDLDGFSHILLLYHFHLSKGHSLEVKPFLDDVLQRCVCHVCLSGKSNRYFGSQTDRNRGLDVAHRKTLTYWTARPCWT